MRIKVIRLTGVASLFIFTLALSGCRSGSATSTTKPPAPLPAAQLLPSDADLEKQTIRFLEDRVKRDPEDFIAHNKLAGQYLQRVRETGDVTYLNLAAKAAHASLATLPPEQNTGGLTALALVEYASHDFVAARDHALQLSNLEPKKSYPYEILGDALLELGEYDKAAVAFHQMEQLGAIQGLTRVAIEQRMARLAALHGDTNRAQRHYTNALTVALALPTPPRETVAWCRWQLGETAFAIGDYGTAERHYRDALTTFPDYFRALASLGRVRAAQGDLAGAIEQYEHAVRIIPDPSFVAVLGDLYKLAGRDKEVAAQYSLVEKIGRLNELNGTLYNRQLALFYADHDLKAEAAYANAAKEYAVRKDVYGADALAWAALKVGKIVEAQTAIKEALRLGTKDARFFYHAGMIAQRAGNQRGAREYLKRALALNPQFDPLQASIARKALSSTPTPENPIRAMLDAVEQIKLGIYCRLSKKFEKAGICKDGYSLAYAVVYEIFADEAGKGSLGDFVLYHREQIAREVRDALDDDVIYHAVSIAFAGELMSLAVIRGEILSDESQRLVDHATNLGVEVANHRPRLGPRQRVYCAISAIRKNISTCQLMNKHEIPALHALAKRRRFR